MFPDYDIIVVGGGHAGCEAAWAAANLGCRVLMITQHLNNVGMMSCNPSIGGVGKGQLVREIDAMGGMMGIVADLSMIQIRMLNKSKGPAMWSPRSQNDRRLYSFHWRRFLESNRNIDFWQDTVVAIIEKDGKVSGVETQMNQQIFATSVIITAGTFLTGKIYIGEYTANGGRIGESGAYGLTTSLNAFGIQSEKLKTGTSVRIDGRTIDFSKLQEQKGDEPVFGFSFTKVQLPQKQLSCHITHTNEKVHDMLRTGFSKSPLFTGRIEGTGPRYCPSVEDKIERFSDKDSHHLFLEPEGWDTHEYYINGFSSSLPFDVQVAALKMIPGLEYAKVLRPGYAIEYDYFPPTQLDYTLESRIIENLYFAGQVNGTTGYEEAGAQGLIAGANAALKIQGKQQLVLGRNQAYIGVLVDDLVTKGVDEPYRLFTSRAEYRLLLRQSSADLRLTPLAAEVGLVDLKRAEETKAKYTGVENLIRLFQKTGVSPDEINDMLEQLGSNPLTQKVPLLNVLLRNEVTVRQLTDHHILLLPEELNDPEIIEEAEIAVKYKSYIEREQEISERLQRLENIRLRPDFEYHALKSLSYEAREKLTRYKPQNIGQASRIPGISPSDLNVLIVFLKK
jgi:tRNA uridine 5-carboxymethylaminomethyl modification enzyme